MRTHLPCWGWLAVILAIAAAGFAGCGTSTPAAGAHTPTAVIGSTSTTLATATATAFSQPTLGDVDPTALGWARAGAPRPDAIAVAPGSPGTLATCTDASGQSGQGLITLSVSTDDGGSWQTQETGIPLARCFALAISPATPRSIALYAGTCRSDCGQGYERLYLSTDAGGHWKQVTPLPDGDTGAVFGWVGTTFFANAAPNGTPTAATQFLAVSRDGVHFAWTSLPAAPQQLFTSRSTLYVVAGSTASCTTAAGVCTDLYRSTDLGISWSRITPTYGGNNVGVVALVPASTTLLGFDARAFAGPNIYPILRSTNGGATWQPLPNAPGSLQADTDAPAVTPDGTIYVTFCCASGGSDAATGIYRLSPGGTTWTLVSPVAPVQVRLVAVSWDTRGHPSKVWGLRDVFPNTSAEITDLWSHPA
jgi:hypothetical protein